MKNSKFDRRTKSFRYDMEKVLKDDQFFFLSYGYYKYFLLIISVRDEISQQVTETRPSRIKINMKNSKFDRRTKSFGYDMEKVLKDDQKNFVLRSL